MRLRRSSRGFALLLVLWMTIILTMILYSVMAEAAAEVRITSTRKKLAQAESLARAGIGRATVDLKNDTIFDDAEEGEAFDAEGDVWAKPEEGKLDEVIKGAPGTFNVTVRNLDGLIQINALGPQSLPLLQRICEDIGYEETDARAVAAAIVDWLDSDTNPGGDNPIGEEGVYYSMLMSEDEGITVSEEDVEPIKIPNEAFQSVDCLLDVYGVTPELFYGPGSPEAEEAAALAPTDGRRKVGERFIIKERPRRGDFVPGLRDYFTIYSSGSININTAPEHVLAAYLGAGGVTDGPSLAETVVRKRRGGRRDDFDNESAYRTMDLVSQDGELFGALSIAQAMMPFDIRGQFFEITSTGEVSRVRKTIKATVVRGLTVLQRDESFEATDRARDRGERLGERSERRTDKDNELLIRQPTVRILAWED